MTRQWTPEQRAILAERAAHIRRREVFFVHDGKRMNMKGWCEYLGISHGTFYGRMKTGWPIEKILSTRKLDRMSDNPISKNDLFEYDGKLQTLTEWAKELGVTIGCLRKRIKAHGPDRALDKNRLPDNARPITFDGQTLSISEWARRLGITQQALSLRLKTKSVNDALAYKSSKYDRLRNQVHYYGEPEKATTGKWFRTEHLEQYLCQSWNPYTTIPDHAGRWYEPIAVYPDEIPGTGEVLGCAA